MEQGFVPESYKKKHARLEQEKAAAVAARKEKREIIKKKREEWSKKARTYHENHQKSIRARVESKREAKNTGKFFVDAEPKVIFAMRLKGINHLAPKPKKILQLLRLRQINNGVFIKVNKATKHLLQRVTPLVTFGYPSRRTISNLVYKRGFGKINRSRIPLTDNAIVEQNLGKFGITCVEDLIEEIYTCGEHFREANNFLWPFKLNNPRGGWSNKNHSFQKGGDWGNRDYKVNELISKMI